MPANDAHFFKALGARIAELRRGKGLSQQALTDELSFPQQPLAHYEVGRARMPVFILPQIAKSFGFGTDDLPGVRGGASKRGPSPKLQQHMEKISRLPKPQPRFLTQMPETVLAQASR